MKKIGLGLLLLCLLVSFPKLKVSAQWQIIHDNSNSFNSIFFVNENVGFVGGNRLFWRTADGGVSWDKLDNIGNSSIQSMFFLNRLAGYYAAGGEIKKTIDGGNSWIHLGNFNQLITSLYFTSIDTGYIVGKTLFQRTTDGGNSWTNFLSVNPTLTGGSYITFKPNDSQRGYVLEGRDVKSLFADTAWASLYKKVSIDINGALSEIFAVDDTIAYVVGGNETTNVGGVGKTINGGLSWIRLTENLKSHDSFNTVSFINRDTGWVAGSHKIFKTINGGVDWDQQSINHKSISKNIIIPNMGITSIFTVNDSAIYGISEKNIMKYVHPSIKNIAISKKDFCSGDSIRFEINVNSSFSISNKFIIQLSDSIGDFSNPLILDSISEFKYVSTHVIIPSHINSGSKYKIRVVATDVLSPTSQESEPFSIYSLPQIMNQPFKITASIGNDISINIQAKGGLFSYQWEKKEIPSNMFVDLDDDNIFSGTSSSTLTISKVLSTLNKSNFRCKIYNSLNCHTTSSVIALDVIASPPTSIKKTKEGGNLKIAPNPNNGKFLIELNTNSKEIFEIKILDLLGKIVYYKKLLLNKESIIPIDISLNNKGIYFIYLEGDNNLKYRKKLYIH